MPTDLKVSTHFEVRTCPPYSERQGSRQARRDRYDRASPEQREHPNMSNTPVTVLGLGDMGTALARALLKAGHRTTVWNRTAAKADALVAEGALRAETVAEAVAASPLVVVCLLDYDSVRQTLDPVAGTLSGTAVANLTSGTPRQAREMAAWAAERGADYLDGGIMAVPPMIATPAAFVLYSGSRSVFETHRAALDALAQSHYLGEDAALAPLQDIALLSGMYGMFSGILHAFALTGSEGIKAADFAPMLQRWLNSMSGAVAGFAAQIDSGEHDRGVVSNLAMQAAAYHHLLEAAEEQGVSPELLAPLGPLMARRVADGHGHEDLSGLVHLLRTRV
ncbi:NAD(P)-binding domain-containing protein [Streptomyces sparsogenes]|uniref:NAD(P)-dependent oxidoreductase n=1 Tax=Streptomyces sparsogenes TaxID=67365 RepID=UPI003332E1C2